MQGKNESEQADELLSMKGLNSLDPGQINDVLMSSETFKNYR